MSLSCIGYSTAWPLSNGKQLEEGCSFEEGLGAALCTLAIPPKLLICFNLWNNRKTWLQLEVLTNKEMYVFLKTQLSKGVSCFD